MSSTPFVIDDPHDIKDRKGVTNVPNDLLDLVNDIFDGGIVANLRTGQFNQEVRHVLYHQMHFPVQI